MQSFNLGRIPPVTFGPGRISKISRMMKSMPKGPILVIADAALVELGTTDKLASALDKSGLPVDIAPVVSGEPKIALIDELCARARSVDAEVIIGLGGGASMDAAKLVAAIAKSGQPAADFALAAQPLPHDTLPAIAIPTTAGTGSEVTRTAVISEADGSKIWFWGEDLMFTQAVLDPDLTLTLPPHLTAWTGIDAVAHALEGATAANTNPAGQLYGLEALRILNESLPKAVADGADAETRAQVLWASMLAGLALHNCNTHMGHNISHALGSLVRVHHGLVTGLALEATLPWLTARDAGSELYAAAAQALGGPAQAQALPEALAALMRACGVERALPAECAGVKATDLAALMKAPANIGMAKNSACEVGDGDMDEMAELMLDLPVLAAP